ncbi:MAG TPA: hypothetical protein DCM86_08915 [Verrucomicrobiales bacterium]|nr:hypothetical protein [Verrucomicrobiales bacterium]
MSMHVRLAAAEDVKPLLDLIRECLGAEHPAKEVYDPGWVSREMCREGGHETWVVDAGPRLDACISFLRPDVAVNPIANLGRNLFRPGTFESGNAQALLEQVRILCAERSELGILRVPASETQQQRLLEGSGCPAVGYQPMKHTRPTREGTLFYMIPEHTVLQRRLPVGELPPQTHALACEVLSSLGLPDPGPVREGITGLPAHPPVHCFDSTLEAFEEWRTQHPPPAADLRLSSSFHKGFGPMRVTSRASVHVLMAGSGNAIVGGVTFLHDELDQCVRILDVHTAPGFSVRPVIQHVLRAAQQGLNASYVEIDVLAGSGRMLRCLEQLGFAPVSYLPGFYTEGDRQLDVVKFAKTNIPYVREIVPFEPAARRMVDIVEPHLADPPLGHAMISLLRDQPLFAGLGDGDLRKIAMLGRQQMYRAGQKVFGKQDQLADLHLVIRGQMDGYLNESESPVEKWTNGQLFGEEALLKTERRPLSAYAATTTIAVMFSVGALQDLMFQEPLLGMTLMRNLAIELSAAA